MLIIFRDEENSVSAVFMCDDLVFAISIFDEVRNFMMAVSVASPNTLPLASMLADEHNMLESVKGEVSSGLNLSAEKICIEEKM